jgi:hypothetical protein
MIDAKRSRHFRTRVCKVNNRAVFEIPEILDEIMAMRQESRAGRVVQAIA